MSRIGKIPVAVPKDVQVTQSGQEIDVKGPKGSLKMGVPNGITVSIEENQLVVTKNSNVKQVRASHGTTRAHLANMVKGVTQGHKKDLEIQGIGFRAQLKGKTIEFNLGFSHPVKYDVDADVTIQVPTQTAISVEGMDITRVGQVAASIRGLKPVEPYKGKGIRYVGEVVRRKQGKSVTK